MQKLRLNFNNNGYSNLFIDNTVKKFEEQPATKNSSQKPEKGFSLTLDLPYFGNSLRQLTKKLSVLEKRKFNADINEYDTTFKTGSYFRRKCSTPLSFTSKFNVVYKFNCSLMRTFHTSV